MYSLSIRRRFIAQHYLVGGDWGPENELHSHQYQVVVRLQGEDLDEHGYLLDIVDLENHLEALVDRYAESTLNELPAFAGLNPSLEHFARIFAQALAPALGASSLSRIEVRLWEDDIAWASFSCDLPCESAS